MMRSASPRFGVPGKSGLYATLLVVLFVTLAVAGGAGQADAPGAIQVSGTQTSSAEASGSSASPDPAENTKTGWIYQATAESSRSFTFQSLHGVTHYQIAVVANAPFELGSVRSPSSVCVGGDNCVQSPDFDVAFYRDIGGTSNVIDRFYSVGSESGRVPGSADFAHVYLRTPGLLPEGSKGWEFVYLQGEAGSDTLPDYP